MYLPTFKAVTLSFAILVSGCGTGMDKSENDQTSQLRNDVFWFERVLSCDAGAAVIDKNTLSPKYPQLVIRNPQIVSYLISRGVNANRQNEVILTGVNDRDVYTGQDFHGFTDLGSGSYRNDWVRREGAVIVVSFNRYKPVANSDCGNSIPSSDPSCQGDFEEVAYWRFQSCN